MSFEAILGQPNAVRLLKRALSLGQVHHAYRFQGPEGVGKELAAFALAQALVCQSPSSEALACNECSSCKRALSLNQNGPAVPQHPDVVLIARGLYAETLGKSEANGISVDQIRQVILNRSGFTSHEGRALVFIIRGAHELTIQAANALLKTLEEPRPNTHFILITSSPGRLLDTIRSRTLAVRFNPLADSVVEQILIQHGADPSAAKLASGSAERALALGDMDLTERRAEFVDSIRRAVIAPDYGSAIAGFDFKNKERAELREELGYLAHSLAERARHTVAQDPKNAEVAAKRFGLVQEAMRQLERNASPALTIEGLVSALRQR